MFKPTTRIDGAHEEGIWAVDWKENHICTGSLDGTVKLWRDNLSLKATSQPQKMGITSVNILRDFSSVISCCQNSAIQIHDTENWESRSFHTKFGDAWTVSISPDNTLVAGGSHNGSINIWSVEERILLNSIEGDSKFILDIAFSPCGKKLATVRVDGLLNIYDMNTGQGIFRVEAHAHAARSVKFSPTGNLLYTASVDRHVNLFDISSPVPVNSFSHTGMVFSLDLSPDNRRFISCCSNHSVHVWDIGIQRCMQSFETQHSDQVWGIHFNDDGNKFVSVGDDSSLQLYECTSNN